MQKEKLNIIINKYSATIKFMINKLFSTFNLEFYLYYNYGWVLSIIKLALVIQLVVATSTKQEYGFYTLLRWCVAGTYCYFAYQAYIKKHRGLVFYFVIIAILFNPMKKVWFGKDIWHIVDYVVAAITAFTIVFDWVDEKRENS